MAQHKSNVVKVQEISDDETMPMKDNSFQILEGKIANIRTATKNNVKRSSVSTIAQKNKGLTRPQGKPQIKEGSLIHKIKIITSTKIHTRICMTRKHSIILIYMIVMR